jgi:hypothetical protein
VAKFEVDSKSLKLEQIVSRCKTVDKHYLKQGLSEDMELSKSDWHNTEKLLQSNFQNVLLFQRGDTTDCNQA